MEIAILLNDSPFKSSLCEAALDFSLAAIKSGHSISRIFLYQDATYLALPMQCPTDEWNPHEAWLNFAKTQGLKIECCVAAAQRRGIKQVEAPFKISGLVSLAEAQLLYDQVVQF